MLTSTPLLPLNQATVQLFYYQNMTSQIQIIRSDQASTQPVEKVVFPEERILFHATAEAFLEIYASTTTGLTLIHRVPCSQLQVYETAC